MRDRLRIALDTPGSAEGGDEGGDDEVDSAAASYGGFDLRIDRQVATTVSDQDLDPTSSQAADSQGDRLPTVTHRVDNKLKTRT